MGATEKSVKAKKITMATLKSFIRKNAGKLYVKVTWEFSGMTDGLEPVKMDWKKVSDADAIGHNGVYCVGGSRDYLYPYEDEKYIGFAVRNCCGCGIIVTKK